ncbi:MAG: gliding motility protein GldN [Sporocytophaga sp.]|nr:gliding motility protein GldN [Sporocytophaga sp.]
MKTCKSNYLNSKSYLLSTCFIIFSFFSFGQNLKQRSCDAMHKKTITRALDLREKQNEGLFAKNYELPGLLIDAAKKNKITAYDNDSLALKLTSTELQERLKIPSAVPSINVNNPADTVDAFIAYGPDWRFQIPAVEEYLANDLYQLEIKEEIIFDKEKSKLIYNILSISLFIPADHPANIKGLQSIVASFSFDELKNNLFKNNPKAISYNTQNEAQHKNLADAFELRLFSSYIVKVSNAKDYYLADIYSDQTKGIMASQWAANELLEYEHHLWEY